MRIITFYVSMIEIYKEKRTIRITEKINRGKPRESEKKRRE